MSKATQSWVMGLLGAALIMITTSGRYTSYVKPGFGPLLLIAGAILVLVGAGSIWLQVRDDMREDRTGFGLDEGVHGAEVVSVHELSLRGAVNNTHEHAHGHSHDRSKAPWLILAPLLVLLLLAPPALGADAVSRNAGSQALAGVSGVTAAAGTGTDVAAGGSAQGYPPNDGSGKAIGTKAFAKQRPTMQFPALPTGKNPVLTLKDFVLRALYDGDDSVSDNNITVIGFIAPTGDGYSDGYSLARLTISCCAADASPMRIHLTGTEKYPVNTWVTAVVSAKEGTAADGNDYVPTAKLISVSPTNQPSDPYEH